MSRRLVLAVLLSVTLNLWAQVPVNRTWIELEEKRAKLLSAHQEFEMNVEFKFTGGTQASKRTVVVDMSRGLWRETFLAGSGNRVQIFDGEDTLVMEEDGDEFVRSKSKPNSIAPMPRPYNLAEIDWPKAKELDRRSCGFAGNDHTCVILQLPLKKRAQLNSGKPTFTEGVVAVAMDTVTGLLIQSKSQETVNNQNGGFLREITYSLKSATIRPVSDATLFRLPSGDLREVKELSQWNASRIKKLLAGKAASELTVVDIKDNPVSLRAFKGRTVLLDFWTTWCAPCRADGPALEKLNKRYGGKELAIIGISVDEERGLVENYLKDHPKSYPVVLTSENEIPRPYQIGVFPTYIVIDQNGNVTSAVEGEKGFGELRSLLQKAGMDAE
jgi:thiol-disulfide isomerase/thioredoxin